MVAQTWVVKGCHVQEHRIHDTCIYNQISLPITLHQAQEVQNCLCTHVAINHSKNCFYGLPTCPFCIFFKLSLVPITNFFCLFPLAFLALALSSLRIFRCSFSSAAFFLASSFSVTNFWFSKLVNTFPQDLVDLVGSLFGCTGVWRNLLIDVAVLWTSLTVRSPSELDLLSEVDVLSELVVLSCSGGESNDDVIWLGGRTGLYNGMYAKPVSSGRDLVGSASTGIFDKILWGL